MNQTQSIALDSCVVIDIMEKPKVASGLKAVLEENQSRSFCVMLYWMK
jgi:hypothetical protein